MRPRPSTSATGTTRAVTEAAPARVTVVESEACHFCADAHQVLREAAANYPLEVHTVDARSPEGQALMQAERATMSPLILLDGQFFSHGRLPRRKLHKVLEQRFAEPGAINEVSGTGARHG
ncbi:MAG: hypothetical protein MUE31_05475 [Candidatus Nanopelagicales bacterium]|nr:hypothetical protein [Candidatus Nanopelagicales bacterium]